METDIRLFNMARAKTQPDPGLQAEGLSETTHAGSQTHEWIVSSGVDQTRQWLRDAPVCRSLQRYGIVHVGVAEANAPYTIVRADLTGTFLMMCFAGAGEVCIEGVWQPMCAGQGYLAPPHASHAYRAIAKQTWGLAWIRYQEPKDATPMVFASLPVLSSFHCDGLQLAVRGLFAEVSSSANPAIMYHWVDLIEGYAQAFMVPWRTDNRIRDVWQVVKTRLDEPWTLDKIADLAGLSPRQFRRVNLHATGASPRDYLTSLRMQLAISLLIETDEKVETIAKRVGHRSLFTFSNRFRAFTGNSPSDYRKSSIR